jgi:hypothetical protein
MLIKCMDTATRDTMANDGERPTALELLLPLAASPQPRTGLPAPAHSTAGEQACLHAAGAGCTGQHA